VPIDGVRAVICGQQDPGRGWILQFDEIGLVLDDEGCAEAAGQRGVRGADLDAKLADRRMGQEAAAEEGVVFALDGAARAGALDPLGTAAAGAVQRQPMAARLEPLAHRAGLRRVGVGAGDIGDQQSAERQPPLDIDEIVGD
jgi:hypothetical protein